MTSPYAQKILDSELTRLRAAPPGRRAMETYRVAANFGGLEAVGLLCRADFDASLRDAAISTGLPESEARRTIRRGLQHGIRNPRNVADRYLFWPPAESPVLAGARAPELRPRPPKDEVRSLLNACDFADSDPGVIKWFHQRYGAHAIAMVDDTSSRWLAYSLPPGGELPTWARIGKRSWREAGYRLIFPLFDHTGEVVSVRARSVYPKATPKSVAPTGFSVKGLFLAEPDHIWKLFGHRDGSPALSELVILEGEPDYLTWAVGSYRDINDGILYLGVMAGSWSRELADLIPSGAKVIIRTHHDPAGDKYAEEIVRTLGHRCQMFRSRPGDDS